MERIDTAVLRRGAIAGYYEANGHYTADNEELGKRATSFLVLPARSMKNLLGDARRLPLYQVLQDRCYNYNCIKINDEFAIRRSQHEERIDAIGTISMTVKTNKLERSAKNEYSRS